MKCFVIAMQKEGEPVIAKTDVTSDNVISGRRVVRGELFGESAAIVICGVGKVNAACGAQLAIDLLGADKIINLGVAGGLSESVEVGRIYSVSHAVQYDFDLTKINGTPLGTLDEFKENYLKLAASPLFPQKRLATGDRFNDSKEDFETLTKILKADIRDMEGAAIAQACIHAGAECYSYKAISDIYGSGSTGEQYFKNLTLCLQNISNNLEKIVKFN